MPKPSNGSVVKYFRVIPGSEKPASFDAIVLGSDPQSDEVKTLPALSLIYFNPEKSIHLSGSDWTHSFDRVDSVPNANKEGYHWYELHAAPKDDETAILREFLLENFKSETGDETPVHCAIRLLSKKAAKK